ncbi:O-antigen translocase [Leeuwenhoekiella sp. LLG6367-2.1]|uniref:O-antigen translocase n=1 Tax=Leeuwenhoekiella sp. LLG6367-2.1 TaxID=3160833 RepID=UPI00386F49C2
MKFRFLSRLLTQNTLLRVSSFNSLGIIIRVGCGLIMSKLIAFYLGASGMAVLGDLRNFLNSVQSIGQLGFSNGVIKYVAEHKEDNNQLRISISTALKTSLIASILVGILLVVYAVELDKYVFNNTYNYATIIKLVGVGLPLLSLNALVLNIINGLGKYRQVIYINVITNLLGVCLSAVLIIKYNLFGALLAIVVSGIISLIIAGLFLLKKASNLKLIFTEKIDFRILKKFSAYGVMTLFSAVTSPWIYMGIRKTIIEVDGIQKAGYWDAMLRLSDYYMMFATTLMTLYVLPKLSEIKTNKDFRIEIFNFYKTILPVFGIGLIIIYIFKTLLIKIVFNTSFLEMQSIFIWQLSGDFFKVASLVIAYQLLAKNRFWTFIITQIISLSIIYITSTQLIGTYGFVGASMGHLISYVLYLILLLFIFRKALFRRSSLI